MAGLVTKIKNMSTRDWQRVSNAKMLIQSVEASNDDELEALTKDPELITGLEKLGLKLAARKPVPGFLFLEWVEGSHGIRTRDI